MAEGQYGRHILNWLILLKVKGKSPSCIKSFINHYLNINKGPDMKRTAKQNIKGEHEAENVKLLADY